MKTLTIITAALLLALPGVARSQTTADEREKIRDLIAERDQATAALQKLSQKLQQDLQSSPEAKKQTDLQTQIDALVKEYDARCEKSGKVLGKDNTKVADFLRCVDKPKEPPKAK